MNRVTLVALAAALVAALAVPSWAQCSPALNLTTALAPNNAQAGYMFDLEPTGGVPLMIQSFDVIPNATTPQTYEVWVRPPLQSWVGFNTSNAGWTQLAITPSLTAPNITSPFPLNLCLGYLLQTGGRTGFYVTVSPPNLTIRYTNGTAVGAVLASNTDLTVYEGNGGAYFAVTFTPRNFTGIIRYDPGFNILSLSQSGPGVGDLTVSLGMVSPTALEGWTLLSADVSGSVGTGPLLGLRPDSLTFLIFGFALLDGNPFHFPVPSAFGLYPNTPFSVGPGSVSSLAGQTFDLVTLMVGPGFSYDGRSNVVRFMFQ